jgi:hypothetical protein
MVCSPPKTILFRGQPDLGGLLEAQQPLSFPQRDLLTEDELPPVKSQSIAASPSEDIDGEQALMSLAGK